MNLDVERILDDTSGRYSAGLGATVQDLIVAIVFKDRTAGRLAEDQLADLVRETLGIAEVLGAQMMLREAAAVLASQKMAADRSSLLAFSTNEIVPRVTFSEAVEDMVTRAPRTIRRAAARTAAAIAALYSKGRNVAFVRATIATVTEAAQRFLVDVLETGKGLAESVEGLQESVVREGSEAWSMGYAQTVVRTNVNTAVTAGRFRQAQDPDIKEVIPAFRFDAVGDADTRHNHKAADGIIMKVDNPAWAKIAPPLGYNCRCQVTLMSTPALRRSGHLTEGGDVLESKIPPGAYPDPGFRHTGRPDLFLGGRT